jgi:hypothetical protein
VADTRAYIDIDYDKVGNRTRVTTKARDVNVQIDSDTAYTYDTMNRQLSAGSHSFSYDANGNRLSDTVIGNIDQLKIRSHGAGTSVPLEPKQEYRGSEVRSRHRLPKY